MIDTNIIIGFDPGGSTGYCVAKVDPNEVLGFKVLRCQVILWNDHIPAIKALLRHYQPITTIVEDFVLYKAKAKDQVGKRFPSVFVTGIIAAYLFEYGLPEMHLRLASTISRTEIPKAHLQHIPQLSADMREHAMDAYKHVRHHIVSQRVAAVVKPVQKKATPRPVSKPATKLIKRPKQ